MPIRTPLEELNKLLRSRCRAWSEFASELPEPGIRAVQVDGGVLRAVVAQRVQQEFFDAIVAALPADAAFVDLDGQTIRIMPAADGYRDCYWLIVASNDWPPLEEGAFIPKLEIKLSRAWWRAASG